MPRKDIWIRKEDLVLWEAIKDKPEWIHTHLQASTVDTESRAISFPVVKKIKKTKEPFRTYFKN